MIEQIDCWQITASGHFVYKLIIQMGIKIFWFRIKRTVAPQSERLMNLKVKANRNHNRELTGLRYTLIKRQYTATGQM